MLGRKRTWDYEAFAEIWRSCRSTAEVREKTRLSSKEMSARRSRCRRVGIELGDLPKRYVDPEQKPPVEAAPEPEPEPIVEPEPEPEPAPRRKPTKPATQYDVRAVTALLADLTLDVREILERLRDAQAMIDRL